MNNFATIEQRPVGQGGFTVGWVETDLGPLRWAYDCGSMDTQPLDDEIRLFCADGTVDLLFISHLHADHISGIDRLLSEGQAVEVVLPYLGDDEIKLLLACGASRGIITSTFLDFLHDPIEWFFRRGVQRVRFIVGGEPRDGFGVDVDRLDDTSGIDAKVKWRAATRQSQRAHSSEDGRVTAAGGLHEGVSRTVAGQWVFWPQMFRPSPTRMSRFLARLHGEFGRKTALRHFAQAATSEDGRRKLRTAYDEIWRDHNLVSMSLYSGPLPGVQCRMRTTSGPGFGEQHRRSPLDAGGWLLTGDAKLTGARRIQSFVQAYGAALNRPTVFQMPHHGSRHSGDWRLFRHLRGAVVGFAAASSNNKYRHPHLEARDDFVRAAGVSVHQVSEQPASVLRTEFFV